jgi:hypothetical protein
MDSGSGPLTSIHQITQERNAAQMLVALWTRDEFDRRQNNFDSFRREAGFAPCCFTGNRSWRERGETLLRLGVMPNAENVAMRVRFRHWPHHCYGQNQEQTDAAFKAPICPWYARAAEEGLCGSRPPHTARPRWPLQAHRTSSSRILTRFSTRSSDWISFSRPCSYISARLFI